MHFSAFRAAPMNRKQRREAFDALGFFEGLQNYEEVRDVVNGPDPPDYVIDLGGRRIAAELTHLNPKVFGQGGYSRRAEFSRWKADEPADPAPQREFRWGHSTLREMLEAFESQVQRKAARALSYATNYDESWLVLQTESGGPAGGLVESKLGSNQGHKESILNFAGKHLFEMSQICHNAAPFDYIILFCGPRLLAFPRGEKLHRLPEPDADLLRRGAQVSDDSLDGRAELFTMSRRSGDVVFWTDFIRIVARR
jgi:hypothetical protein